MKKFLLFVFVLFCFPLMFSAESRDYVSESIEESFKEEGISYDLGDYETSDDKVNVYLFRGNGCSHCKNFLQFVSDTLVKDYGEYFNLISYEVRGNADNYYLKNEVAKALNFESKGVPFIVIGDKFFSGYNSSKSEAIINLIKSTYEDKNRVDVVSEVINGTYKPVSGNHNAIVNNSNDNKEEVKVNESKAIASGNAEFDTEVIVIILGTIVAISVLVFVILFYKKINKSK